MTSGNYDESGGLIEEEIPTITTDLCEIGSYGDVCYFTIILPSHSLDKDLFKKVKNYKNLHIYGLESYKEDYFPREGISFDNLRKELSKEKYAQIQFNFEELEADRLLQEYFEVKELFSGIKVFNQLKSKP